MFLIELVTYGHSKCEICRKLIPKGSKRVAITGRGGFYGQNFRVTAYYHFDCIKDIIQRWDDSK
jgi:hypothetical protein